MSTVDRMAHIRLELASRAENVMVVRQALNGLADATGLDQGDLNDISTAVTEACNNVAVHAYAGSEGPLYVELLARDRTMIATVRDRGVGLGLADGPPAEFPTDVEGELSGIGMPSIKALTASARWREPAGGGTEVEMTFATMPLAWDGYLLGEGLTEPLASGPDRNSGAIEVMMAPMVVARSVLLRLLRVMASRAQFSVQRHTDVQRIAAVVLGTAHSSWSSLGVQATLIGDSRSFEVAIGPMSDEDVSRLALAAHAIEPKLRISTEHLDDGPQRLVLHL